MWNEKMKHKGLEFTLTNSMDSKLSVVIGLDDTELIKAISEGDERIAEIFDHLPKMAYEYCLIQDILELGMDYGVKYFFNSRDNDIEKSFETMRIILNSPYCPDDLKEKLEDTWHGLASIKHKRQLAENRKASKKKRPVNGDVYLLEALIGNSRSYKIGWARNAKDRSNLFEVKLPFDFELIHVFPADNARQAESALHERFKHCRINGEWFALSDEDVSTVQKIGRYADKEFLWDRKDADN